MGNSKSTNSRELAASTSKVGHGGI